MRTIYIVYKGTGAYDEYAETNLKAFGYKPDAVKYVKALREEQARFLEKFKDLQREYEFLLNMSFFSEDYSEEEEQKWFDAGDQYGIRLEHLRDERDLDKEIDKDTIYDIEYLEFIE